MNSARDPTLRLASLLRDERNALADFLVLLADFDRRRLWLELGHASLFSFLHRELGLSRGAAHYRKTASDLVQRFPEVIEHLREGRLCITSVVEVARVLTTENRGEVLPRFFHLSKREAAEVAAEIRPDENAPRRAVVTVVRAAAGAVSRATEPAPLFAGAGRSSGAGVQLEGRPHANSAPPPAAMMSQAAAPTASPALHPTAAPAREARPVTVPSPPTSAGSTSPSPMPSSRGGDRGRLRMDRCARRPSQPGAGTSG